MQSTGHGKTSYHDRWTKVRIQRVVYTLISTILTPVIEGSLLFVTLPVPLLPGNRPRVDAFSGNFTQRRKYELSTVRVAEWTPLLSHAKSEQMEKWYTVKLPLAIFTIATMRTAKQVTSC
ncbi:hypothetical protein PMIN04_005395 [Paraphaeosphaeria minitans]